MTSPTHATTPAGAVDRAPLSHTQEFLCAFDNGDPGGPFGPRYHNSRGIRLTGQVDLQALRLALADLVERHEALRTLLVRDTTDPHQQILPPSPPRLVLHDLSGVAPSARSQRAEEFLNEIEAGAVPVDELPLLQAHLGRFDDRDAILVLIAHHVATDGWSMRIITSDLASHYGIRTGNSWQLPPIRQYREHTLAERGEPAQSRVDHSRPYWREKLRGARMLAIPMDRPRSAGHEKVTSTYRFEIGPELSSAVLRFARATRSSAFMILLAGYGALLNRITGATDIVVPTITSGRTDPRFERTVGPFFNFLPLRTDLAGCETWRDVLLRTRSTCIEAQTHEIPFGYIAPEAPELMAPFQAGDLAVGAMQVFQHPFSGEGEMDRGVLSYSELNRRLLFQPISSSIPDGVLWTLAVEAEEGIIGAVKFNRNEFDVATFAGQVGEFREVLRRIVATPGTPFHE